MEFVELDEIEFDKYSKNHNQASFMQTTELGNFRKSEGRNIYYLGVKKKKELLCATLLEEEPVLFGYKLFYAPRGFLIDYHDKELLKFFVENITNFVKKRKGFKIVIDPNLVYQVRNSDGTVGDYKPDKESFDNIINLGFKHFGFNEYLEARQVRYAYRMELDEEYEIKKTKFSKSTRKNIDNSLKSGLSIRIGNKDDLDIMQKLFQSTADRKEFYYRKLDYYKEMYKYMGDLMTIYFAYLDPEKYLEAAKANLKEEEDNNKEIDLKMSQNMVGEKLKKQKEVSDNKLVKLRDELNKAEEFKKTHSDGLDIACLLSMWNGQEYLTLTSGGLEEYLSFTPKYLMYDAHIKDAYKNNYKACNFYGISGNFNRENNPFYGVYEFKRGFSGNVIEYIGEFELKTSWFYNFYEFLKKIKKLFRR